LLSSIDEIVNIDLYFSRSNEHPSILAIPFLLIFILNLNFEDKPYKSAQASTTCFSGALFKDSFIDSGSILAKEGFLLVIVFYDFFKIFEFFNLLMESNISLLYLSL
jgi:hypothetical protein